MKTRTLLWEACRHSSPDRCNLHRLLSQTLARLAAAATTSRAAARLLRAAATARFAATARCAATRGRSRRCRCRRWRCGCRWCRWKLANVQKQIGRARTDVGNCIPGCKTSDELLYVSWLQILVPICLQQHGDHPCDMRCGHRCARHFTETFIIPVPRRHDIYSWGENVHTWAVVTENCSLIKLIRSTNCDGNWNIRRTPLTCISIVITSCDNRDHTCVCSPLDCNFHSS